MDERKVKFVCLNYTILGMDKLSKTAQQAAVAVLHQLVGSLDPTGVLGLSGIAQLLPSEEFDDDHYTHALMEIAGDLHCAPHGSLDRCGPADLSDVLAQIRLEVNRARPAELLGQDTGTTKQHDSSPDWDDTDDD